MPINPGGIAPHGAALAPQPPWPSCRAAGVQFCEAANADFATVRAAGNSQLLAITGSQHLDFSDLGLLRGSLDSLLPVGPIEAERMTVITRDLVRSFLDEYLGDAPAASFTAAIGPYPELR